MTDVPKTPQQLMAEAQHAFGASVNNSQPEWIIAGALLLLVNELHRVNARLEQILDNLPT
jgi:hypothetical protein